MVRNSIPSCNVYAEPCPQKGRSIAKPLLCSQPRSPGSPVSRLLRKNRRPPERLILMRLPPKHPLPLPN